MSITFLLNGKSTALDADPNMPLLWAIREVAGLHADYAGLSVRLDNLDRRVGRIEQRLELVDVPSPG